MKRLVCEVFEGLLDLVYPPFCLVCGAAGGEYLCGSCVETISLIGPERCRKCGTPTQRRVCSDCEVRQYAFECAFSAGIYDGALRQAIHSFKYDNRIALADTLAELMIGCFPGTGLRGRVDVIVPVPVHHSRVIERGFNQAEELADRLARKVGLSVLRGALVKTRKTPHQADLPQDLRYANVQGVFAVKRSGDVVGKRVLLVDDVFTTGSTLSESAQVLRDAGAAVVFGYTLARSV